MGICRVQLVLAVSRDGDVRVTQERGHDELLALLVDRAEDHRVGTAGVVVFPGVESDEQDVHGLFVRFRLVFRDDLGDGVIAEVKVAEQAVITAEEAGCGAEDQKDEREKDEKDALPESQAAFFLLRFLPFSVDAVVFPQFFLCKGGRVDRQRTAFDDLSAGGTGECFFGESALAAYAEVAFTFDRDVRNRLFFHAFRSHVHSGAALPSGLFREVFESREGIHLIGIDDPGRFREDRLFVRTFRRSLREDVFRELSALFLSSFLPTAFFRRIRHDLRQEFFLSLRSRFGRFLSRLRQRFIGFDHLMVLEPGAAVVLGLRVRVDVDGTVIY